MKLSTRLQRRLRIPRPFGHPLGRGDARPRTTRIDPGIHEILDEGCLFGDRLTFGGGVDRGRRRSRSTVGALLSRSVRLEVGVDPGAAEHGRHRQSVSRPVRVVVPLRRRRLAERSAAADPGRCGRPPGARLGVHPACGRPRPAWRSGGSDRCPLRRSARPHRG